MEKSILKTLIYADIFEYPLKAWEIHKWLIGKKASLRQVERALRGKGLGGRVQNKAGYYFLKRREKNVRQRLQREKISGKYFRQAKFASFFLKIIPWVKLVGVSGSLSMMNATKLDDIDFFIITEKKRLWLSRLLIIGTLNILNIRRKPADSKKNAKGKICVNLLLDEESLSQSDKNIYLAHEILQMMPLWERDNVYSKYLEENAWAFKLLPNWISTRGPVAPVSQVRPRELIVHLRSTPEISPLRHPSLLNLLESASKWIQLNYMSKPKGQEKITETALYFHPEDKGKEILNIYNRKIKRIDL